ncbi:MAG TPA: undecaprenyl-diphosphate phosphatase [Stellaceae bacterium]|nr:undecaprenyl-diphosphate phosphatase [Stellaceae bacterium]
MTALQAYLTAFLQGVTELFPISSLGHAVLLPKVAGWHIDQEAPGYLPFLVVLHLGTAAALLLYFWREWIDLLRAVLGRPTRHTRADELRLLALIVVATIPAIVIGFVLEKRLRLLFGAPAFAALFLILNGFVLFAGERLRRRAVRRAPPALDEDKAILSALGWRGALLIGLWQCTAFLPGISRSGATMVGGLLAGLHHREAARFSFLIATPVIAGAGVLEVPKLLHHHGAMGGTGFTGLALVSGIIAGVTAYASIAFLMRYFGKHDVEALDPFAWYCWAVGAAALGWLAFA